MKKCMRLPYQHTSCSDRKLGFTLIEILITTVLAFLLFTMIYATFFSISTVTTELQNKMRSSEVLFGFLNKFNEEIKCMIYETDDKDTLFSSEELTFITKDRISPYPVRITYFIETSADGIKTLFRKQENLLYDYSFVFPVLSNVDSVNFLFYDGNDWGYSIENEQVTGLGIEVDYSGEKIFLPVKIYREKPDEEKEKQ